MIVGILTIICGYSLRISVWGHLLAIAIISAVSGALGYSSKLQALKALGDDTSYMETPTGMVTIFATQFLFIAILYGIGVGARLIRDRMKKKG